jgi:hypothetical protein
MARNGICAGAFFILWVERIDRILPKLIYLFVTGWWNRRQRAGHLVRASDAPGRRMPTHVLGEQSYPYRP